MNPLTTIQGLIDEAEAELAAVAESMRDLTKQRAALEAKLQVLLEARGKITSPEPAREPSLQDRVLRIIEASGGAGASASEIREALQQHGTVVRGKNPDAAVHVAASRLSGKGLVSISKIQGVKRYYARTNAL